MSEPLTCPLCGFVFEKQETPCQHGCPLGRFCQLVCCPNCRYEFTPQRQPFAWLQRWFHRRRAGRAVGGVCGLPDLNEGETTELVGIISPHPQRRTRLAVFGLVPGSQLTLQQKRPSYIVRVGETELAIDAEIARELIVRRGH
jgi:Fe2+ transport system protein FeoA